MNTSLPGLQSQAASRYDSSSCFIHISPIFSQTFSPCYSSGKAIVQSEIKQSTKPVYLINTAELVFS